MEDLDQRYKKNGFKVPENYFEEFDDQLIERIKLQQPEARPVFSVWKKKAWLAAASVAILSCITYIAYQGSGAQPNQEISFNNIDADELIAYENEVELSEDEFEEMIPAYTIDSLYQAEILPAADMEFSNEDIQDLEDEFSALDEETEI